jgi:hypothetical protein
VITIVSCYDIKHAEEFVFSLWMTLHFIFSVYYQSSYLPPGILTEEIMERCVIENCRITFKRVHSRKEN